VNTARTSGHICAEVVPLKHGGHSLPDMVDVGRGGLSCPLPVPAIPYLTVTPKPLISLKSVSHPACVGAHKDV
jgi:hypothetical protein